MSFSHLSEDKAQSFALIFSSVVIIGYCLPWVDFLVSITGFEIVYYLFAGLIEFIKLGSKSAEQTKTLLVWLLIIFVVAGILFCHIINIIKTLKNSPKRGRVFVTLFPIIILLLLYIAGKTISSETVSKGSMIEALNSQIKIPVGIIFVLVGMVFSFISALISKDTFFTISPDAKLKKKYNEIVETYDSNPKLAQSSSNKQRTYWDEQSKNIAIANDGIKKLLEKTDSINSFLEKIYNEHKQLNEKISYTINNTVKPADKVNEEKVSVEARLTEILNQANSLFKAGDFPAALEYYNKAIEISSDNFVIYSKRANTYFMLKDYDKSIEDYSKALRIKPNSGITFYYRGYAKLMKKDFRNAKIDLQTAFSSGIKQAGELIDKYFG